MEFEKNTISLPSNIGISFMLIVFLILCMVIYAVLSFSNAAKDYQYSEEKAAKTTAYYDASNRAEEKMVEILAQNPTEPKIEYSVPVNDNEELLITLSRNQGENSSYIVTSKVLQSTKEWIGDQTLPVLGKE